MTESPDCILVWVFLVLTIALAICGIVGCCVACCARGASRKRGRDDVEMQWNPREPVARPPPPPKRWSPEERQALARAVSGLPPSCLQDVRTIVGGDESTFEVAAPAGPLGVSISRDTISRSASGPLAGRVAVGDRLVSISTPGRALFTCGPTATGHDIIDELRAGAGSDGRVLTFARVDFASLDVSVCDRLQRYVDARRQKHVDAQKTCLCGAPKNWVCVVSGILLVCVVPATCGLLYFGFHCFADLYGATT